LIYRDVERASYELAAVRGRPDFILHISRLADIENHGVVPGLHKLYTLAALYHLSRVEIFRWYDAPLEDCFHEHPSIHARRTELLSRMVEKWEHFEGVLTDGHNHHTYGYIGISDRRMVPILRPGSIVLVDTSKNNVEDGYWTTEHDRPMYFVDVRAGYRCGWFHQDGGRLVMHPHPLSHCPPEAWRTPEEADIVGQLQGLLRI
jgi:hypothetical protein